MMKKILVVLSLLALPAASYAARDPGHTAPPPDCSKDPGVLPDPTRPAGTPDPNIPVEHVVILMQENRSFDHYFGHLNDPKYYGDEVDGLSPEMSNPRIDGTPVPVFHQPDLCSHDIEHGWSSSHRIWNEGYNDRYVIENSTKKMPGDRAMGFYTDEDIPFYYDLANTFAIGDRHFASVLGPTVVNRMYMMAGTSYGHVKNAVFTMFKEEWGKPNIFELLEAHHISWGYYFNDLPYPLFFQKTFWKHLNKLHFMTKYYLDLKMKNLPQVVFLETAGLVQSEHPPLDIQIGQGAVARHVKALMKSRYWKSSALFFTYDEGGGFYDHVGPPAACKPDNIAPKLNEDPYDAQFDRLGFRVPLIVVSPYAKRHHVSHKVSDHTSLLAFLEHKFNLPPLTKRDANADPLLDYFDFEHPDFSVPKLAKAEFSWNGLWSCVKHVPDYLGKRQKLVSELEKADEELELTPPTP